MLFTKIEYFFSDVAFYIQNKQCYTYPDVISEK